MHSKVPVLEAAIAMKMITTVAATRITGPICVSGPISLCPQSMASDYPSSRWPRHQYWFSKAWAFRFKGLHGGWIVFAVSAGPLVKLCRNSVDCDFWIHYRFRLELQLMYLLNWHNDYSFCCRATAFAQRCSDFINPVCWSVNWLRIVGIYMIWC